MITTFITKILNHRRKDKESKRLWLEGVRLEKAGWCTGTRYNVIVQANDNEAFEIVLSKAVNGTHIVSGRKSRPTPIIDLTNQALLKSVELEQEVVATITEETITVTLSAVEQAKRSRRLRWVDALAKTNFKLANLFTGAGFTINSVQKVLSEIGYSSQVTLGVEFDPAIADIGLYSCFRQSSKLVKELGNGCVDSLF